MRGLGRLAKSRLRHPTARHRQACAGTLCRSNVGDLRGAGCAQEPWCMSNRLRRTPATTSRTVVGPRALRRKRILPMIRNNRAKKRNYKAAIRAATRMSQGPVRVLAQISNTAKAGTGMPRKRRTALSHEPPAPLTGAAAPARALAERIRSGNASLKSAREQPPVEELRTTARALRSQPLGKGPPSRPRFAKTIEAAKLMNASTSHGQELVPWHLSLREEVDARSRPKRWMARVFGRRGASRESEVAAPRFPAEVLGSGARASRTRDSATVAAVEPLSRRAPNGGASAGVKRSPAGERAALVDRPDPRACAAGAKEGAGPDGVVRLQGLRARDLPWDQLSHGLASETGREAGRWRHGSASAASLRRGLAAAGAPGHHGPTTDSTARSEVAVVAPHAVSVREVIVATTAAPEAKAKLSIAASGRKLICWPRGALAGAKVEPEISTSRQSAASARPEAARSRAAMRLLLISRGIFAGFALGIVISGSALITNFDLGQIVPQLDELLPDSGTAPARGWTSDGPQVVSSSPAPAAVQAAGALAVARFSQDDMAVAAAGSNDRRRAPLAASSAAPADSGPAEPAGGLVGER